MKARGSQKPGYYPFQDLDEDQEGIGHLGILSKVPIQMSALQTVRDSYGLEVAKEATLRRDERSHDMQIWNQEFRRPMIVSVSTLSEFPQFENTILFTKSLTLFEKVIRRRSGEEILPIPNTGF